MPDLTGPKRAAPPSGNMLAAFVRAQTTLTAPELVPEVLLHLSRDPWHLWEATERLFGSSDAPPPFWAFAWAGGQALARYVLDHPDSVEGRPVLDIATGSGLAAIAAARAGAAAVTAADIDPLAVTAAGLNAAANAVTVAADQADLRDGASLLDRAGVADGPEGGFGRPGTGVVLIADACYEKELAGQVMHVAQCAVARGARVLVADIGRRYLPRGRFREVAAYQVPVLRALEDADVKRAAVLEPAW